MSQPASPPRVVLIDDNTRLVALLTEILPELGVDIAGIAYDGTDTIATVETALLDGAVDAIVMDERMPHMNGLDATRALAATLPSIPVILHTAYAGQLGSAPSEAGVFAEIAKGCAVQELIDVIHKACQASQSDPPSVAAG